MASSGYVQKLGTPKLLNPLIHETRHFSPPFTGQTLGAFQSQNQTAPSIQHINSSRTYSWNVSCIWLLISSSQVGWKCWEYIYISNVWSHQRVIVVPFFSNIKIQYKYINCWNPDVRWWYHQAVLLPFVASFCLYKWKIVEFFCMLLLNNLQKNSTKKKICEARSCVCEWLVLVSRFFQPHTQISRPSIPSRWQQTNPKRPRFVPNRGCWRDVGNEIIWLHVYISGSRLLV